MGCAALKDIQDDRGSGSNSETAEEKEARNRDFKTEVVFPKAIGAVCCECSADRRRGQRKGPTCQKKSKIVKKVSDFFLFDKFRAGQKGKNRQKMSKMFLMAANWQRGFEVKKLYYANSIVYFWVPP